jgi:DNA polymerase-3 subunit epsilon
MILLGYDLETTGTSVAHDRPVQISLVSFDPSTSGTRVLLNALCNPCKAIDPKASEVHGITAERLANMPDYAIALWQVALMVDALKPDALVTMNGKTFDVPMTANLLGVDPFAGLMHFDILQIAFRYYPELKSRKLSALHQHFLNESLEGAHDATADVIGSLRVFEAMRRHLTMPYEKLHEELAQPKPYSVIPFGKYAGCLIDEVPRSWAVFMNKQGDLSADLQATVDAILGAAA